MKKKKYTYIEILKWAFEKEQDGFTRKQLRDEFELDGYLNDWVENTFFHGTNGDGPLIDHYVSVGGEDYFTLSRKGIESAISYLQLEETQKSGDQSKKVAYVSIWIAIIIGLCQIIISICN